MCESESEWNLKRVEQIYFLMLAAINLSHVTLETQPGLKDIPSTETNFISEQIS